MSHPPWKFLAVVLLLLAGVGAFIFFDSTRYRRTGPQVHGAYFVITDTGTVAPLTDRTLDDVMASQGERLIVVHAFGGQKSWLFTFNGFATAVPDDAPPDFVSRGLQFQELPALVDAVLEHFNHPGFPYEKLNIEYDRWTGRAVVSIPE